MPVPIIRLYTPTHTNGLIKTEADNIIRYSTYKFTNRNPARGFYNSIIFGSTTTYQNINQAGGSNLTGYTKPQRYKKKRIGDILTIFYPQKGLWSLGVWNRVCDVNFGDFKG
jgi:hypothetical protein